MNGGQFDAMLDRRNSKSLLKRGGTGEFSEAKERFQQFPLECLKFLNVFGGHVNCFTAIRQDGSYADCVHMGGDFRGDTLEM